MSEQAGQAVRRVLLVDDHPIVRQGLSRMIANEPGLAVCGEAETVREARQAVRDLEPDVVVVDLSLKEGDGIELVRELRAHPLRKNSGSTSRSLLPIVTEGNSVCSATRSRRWVARSAWSTSATRFAISANCTTWVSIT